jgi:hypothetical protein
MFSSTADMATLGHATLTSTIINPTLTRRWPNPVAYTSITGAAIGVPRADLLINKPRLLVCFLVCFVIKQPIKPRGLILAVNQALYRPV